MTDRPTDPGAPTPRALARDPYWQCQTCGAKYDFGEASWCGASQTAGPYCPTCQGRVELGTRITDEPALGKPAGARGVLLFRRAGCAGPAGESPASSTFFGTVEELREPAGVTVSYGDDGHDGAGWYWWESDYPTDGSEGAFATEEEAKADARSRFPDRRVEFDVPPVRVCRTCSHFEPGHCGLTETMTTAGSVCDAWAGGEAP